MALYIGNHEVEFKWARYGGIESDASLDILTVFVWIQWPKRLSENIEEFYYPEIALTDFGFHVPQDTYIIDWGDGHISLDITEYIKRAKHTYAKEVFQNDHGSSILTIEIKGHDMKAWMNSKNGTFIQREYLKHKLYDKMYAYGIVIPKSKETILEYRTPIQMIRFAFQQMIERDTKHTKKEKEQAIKTITSFPETMEGLSSIYEFWKGFQLQP